MQMIEYGKIIKDIRTAKQMTQEELAQMTGKTQGYITSLENGRIDMPGIDFIGSLILKLDINPYIFFKEDNQQMFVKNADDIRELKKKLNKYEKLINQLVNEMNGK